VTKSSREPKRADVISKLHLTAHWEGALAPERDNKVEYAVILDADIASVAAFLSRLRLVVSLGRSRHVCNPIDFLTLFDCVGWFLRAASWCSKSCADSLCVWIIAVYLWLMRP